MTTPEDFFAPDGPPRDRYGRPMLIPRGVERLDENRKPYTRASSLADYLADFSHIWKWKMRYLTRSLGYHRDLAMLAAAETYTTGFDKGDEKENRASGKRLDDIIERALERQGISEKADYGTAVHAWTEPGNDGYVFPEAAADVESHAQWYRDHGAVILATEVFTANDDLMVSGTFDNLVWVPGHGIVILDKKTSAKVHGADFRIQLATYAGADIYDWETDERMTLEEFVESLGWDPALINRSVGIILHIKDGKTTSYRLDLAQGRIAAEKAVWVRDHHKRGTHQWAADKDIRKSLEKGRAELLEDIKQAPDIETIHTLCTPQHIRALWTDEHTQAYQAKKEAS